MRLDGDAGVDYVQGMRPAGGGAGDDASLGRRLDALLMREGCPPALRGAVRAAAARALLALVGPDTPLYPHERALLEPGVREWAKGYNKAKAEIRARLAREL